MLEKDDAAIAELDKAEKDLREAFDALSIKISDWFPDPGLAKTVADQLEVTVDDEIFQNKLDEINRLYCQYKNIKDLTGLRYLKNLTSLNIYGNRNLEDISELAYCKKIGSLQAHECNISNIDALANSKSLSMLRLEHNKITDISALASHPNLYSLSINNNQITDISPINKLEKLRDIYFAYNQISDLSNVYWPVVTVISAAGNPVFDISGLKDSNRLTTLTVSSGNNEIMNGINSLSNKDTLTILTLGASLKQEDLESINTCLLYTSRCV
ncbi:hypothetical protein A5868_000596 [Enterococcus sp. 12F9_DIV0723]|nr:hypothetical protein A5868_000596 [Enterococcus sp. 12F9_DIV0723]